MRTSRIRTAVVSVAAVAALALAGCSSDGDNSTSEATASGSQTSSAAAAAGDGQTSESEVTLTDGWVRADKDKMTGIFGTLHNPTDKDLVLTSADVDVKARAEMHETVQNAGSSVMQEAKNGLTIPAGGTLELKPGSFHIMLMDLAEPVKIGQGITLTLHFDDGTTAEVKAAGRAFEGGNEEYRATDHGSMGSGESGDAAGHGEMNGMDHGNGEAGDMTGMDHGDHAGHDHN